MTSLGSNGAAAMDAAGDPLDFRRQIYSQMRSTGIIQNVKSQLRTQLLSQLQKGQLVKLQPPPGDSPNLWRRALNSMIAEYLGAVGYGYSLSVFREESGVEAGPLLSEHELLHLLKMEPRTMLHTAYERAKHTGRAGNAFMLQLLEAVAETAAGSRGSETATQTAGGERFQLEMQLQQLEDGYGTRLRAEQLRPTAGLEERLALYRQEIEDQAKAEVKRQVERIRDIEIASMRLEEATKFRKATEGERLQLDRLHHDRLAKLRQREEEVLDRLRRQQRDVENVAFEHRQKILREEERLSTWKTEQNHLLDTRQDQLKNLERSLELRERAVTAREKDAERRLAEAAEALVGAGQAARSDVERDYMELKSGLQHQRMQLEVDRNRVMELRSEATAEIAAARAKEDRLRALEAARAEAEARAAAFAADNEMLRLQAERCQSEAMQARAELSRRIAMATDSADAMLHNAAGALGMLESESMTARNAVLQLRTLQEHLARLQKELQTTVTARDTSSAESVALRQRLATALAEAGLLGGRVDQLESLVDEAMAGRELALRAVEDTALSADQMMREAADLRAQLQRAREELQALRLQLVAQAHSNAPPRSQGRPVSRGGQDYGTSPGRRGAPSAFNSPQHRPATARSGMLLGGQATPSLWTGAGSVGWAVPVPPVPASLAAPGRSPVRERLDELSRQDTALSAEFATFRRRAAREQDAAEREVGSVLRRVGLSVQDVANAAATQQRYDSPGLPPSGYGSAPAQVAWSQQPQQQPQQQQQQQQAEGAWGTAHLSLPPQAQAQGAPPQYLSQYGGPDPRYSAQQQQPPQQELQQYGMQQPPPQQPGPFMQDPRVSGAMQLPQPPPPPMSSAPPFAPFSSAPLLPPASSFPQPDAAPASGRPSLVSPHTGGPAPWSDPPAPPAAPSPPPEAAPPPAAAPPAFFLPAMVDELPAAAQPTTPPAASAASSPAPFTLMMVSDFGAAPTPPAAAAPPSPEPESPPSPPPPPPSFQDMQAAQEAKKRMLLQAQQQRIAEQEAADAARQRQEREEELKRQAAAAAAAQSSEDEDVASQTGSSAGSSVRGLTAPFVRGPAVRLAQQELSRIDSDSSLMAMDAPRIQRDSTAQESSLLLGESSDSMAAMQVGGMDDDDDMGLDAAGDSDSRSDRKSSAGGDDSVF